MSDAKTRARSGEPLGENGQPVEEVEVVDGGVEVAGQQDEEGEEGEYTKFLTNSKGKRLFNNESNPSTPVGLLPNKV